MESYPNAAFLLEVMKYFEGPVSATEVTDVMAEITCTEKRFIRSQIKETLNGAVNYGFLQVKGKKYCMRPLPPGIFDKYGKNTELQNMDQMSTNNVQLEKSKSFCSIKSLQRAASYLRSLNYQRPSEAIITESAQSSYSLKKKPVLPLRKNTKTCKSNLKAPKKPIGGARNGGYRLNKCRTLTRQRGGRKATGANTKLRNVVKKIKKQNKKRVVKKIQHQLSSLTFADIIDQQSSSTFSHRFADPEPLIMNSLSSMEQFSITNNVTASQSHVPNLTFDADAGTSISRPNISRKRTISELTQDLHSENSFKRLCLKAPTSLAREINTQAKRIPSFRPSGGDGIRDNSEENNEPCQKTRFEN